MSLLGQPTMVFSSVGIGLGDSNCFETITGLAIVGTGRDTPTLYESDISSDRLEVVR